MSKRSLDEMERLAEFVRQDLDRLEREIARARDEERRYREKKIRLQKNREIAKKTRICKYWQNRRCRDTRETCPYAHGADDMKGALPIVRKSEVVHKQAAEFLASLHISCFSS